MRRPPLPVRLVTVAGVGALVLVACGGGTPSADPAGEARVPVTVTESGCEPGSLTAPSGRVVFEVTNAGPDIGEFEILDGDRVVDELENIVPGTNADLAMTLEAGDYQVICYEDDAPRATLTVAAAT
jgi:iron uptake system EfeUOB component EfeO/EfeM